MKLEKIVLLHYNGRSRDPAFNASEFSPCHWIYFNGCLSTTALKAESDVKLWISDLKIYPYPDIIYREFENGLVIANPALHNITIEMDKLFPCKKFKRLTATKTQDALVNNGSAVGAKLELDERDAVFLAKIK